MLETSPAEQIRQFTAWLAGTDISELEFRSAHGGLLIRRDVATPVPHEPAPPPAPARETAITASSVGVFLRQHPLRDAPAAQAGQAVRAGHILGFLRVGALLLPVSAPRDGVILDVPALDGAVVGYGATLIRLLPGHTDERIP
jgi:acetyl-CoA carboxylase biotin carboxyl carrier protein